MELNDVPCAPPSDRTSMRRMNLLPPLLEPLHPRSQACMAWHWSPPHREPAVHWDRTTGMRDIPRKQERGWRPSVKDQAMRQKSSASSIATAHMVVVGLGRGRHMPDHHL